MIAKKLHVSMDSKVEEHWTSIENNISWNMNASNESVVKLDLISARGYDNSTDHSHQTATYLDRWFDIGDGCTMTGLCIVYFCIIVGHFYGWSGSEVSSQSANLPVTLISDESVNDLTCYPRTAGLFFAM